MTSVAPLPSPHYPHAHSCPHYRPDVIIAPASPTHQDWIKVSLPQPGPSLALSPMVKTFFVAVNQQPRFACYLSGTKPRDSWQARSLPREAMPWPRDECLNGFCRVSGPRGSGCFREFCRCCLVLSILPIASLCPAASHSVCAVATAVLI